MMKNISIKATEIMFLLGFCLFSAGIGLKFGVSVGFIAAGSVLLLAAFRNAAEREKGN